MSRRYLFVAACLIVVGTVALCAKTDNSENMLQTTERNVLVDMHTSLGDIRLMLYGDTPSHLKNFVRLADDGYYDGVLFHRVIKDFMVQTGDPDSKTAVAGQRLGMGSPDYKIDAEILPAHFHKRGALAAAREGDAVNPERRSSGSQFYIVTGKKFSAEQLDGMERNMKRERMQHIFNELASQHRDSIMTLRRNRDAEGLRQLQEDLVKQTESKAAQMPDILSEEQREAYITVGGAPHLDGGYTVFGEVVDGMDVVDSIEAVHTDRYDRPIDDVKVLSMKVVR